MRTYSQRTFLPIGTIVQTAIGRVASAFSMLFRLMIVRWMIEGMLLGICLSLFVTAGSGSILSLAVLDQTYQFPSYFSPFLSVNTFIFLLGIGLIALLYFIAACMLQMATIFAVSRGEHHLSLAALFHLSSYRFVAFISSQILCAFLIVGGLFAFILPGIGMLLFFTFVPYIILFEKKSGLSAIQRSVQLIASHPLPLLGRISLLWFIWLSLNVFLTNSVFQTLGVIPHVALILVANMCLWWYSSAYIYLLYRESVEKSVRKQVKPIHSHVALSLCGWGIAVFAVISLYNMLQTIQANDMQFRNAQPPIQTESLPSLHSAPLKEM